MKFDMWYSIFRFPIFWNRNRGSITIVWNGTRSPSLNCFQNFWCLKLKTKQVISSNHFQIHIGGPSCTWAFCKCTILQRFTVEAPLVWCCVACDNWVRRDLVAIRKPERAIFPVVLSGHWSRNTVATCHFFHLTCDFQSRSPQWPSRNPDSVPLRKNLIYLQNDTVFHCFQDSGAPPGICQIPGAIFNFPEGLRKKKI